MTIDEAKTKVCPFMVDYTFEANDCTATRYKNCICGKCMAWETTLSQREKDKPDTEIILAGYCKRLEK